MNLMRPLTGGMPFPMRNPEESMPDRILSDLNPSQREAVSWDPKPLLVLAGAGSGKTRILTRRIAFLIRSGVPAFQVLGVTFTNKAAQEMKARVQKLVDQEVWVSTFHSTCLRILRVEGAGVGIDPNFGVYDESDQKTLIKECIKELNLNEKQIHPKAVRERIQRAKDFLLTPGQYAEKSADIFEETVARVYQLYEKKLAKLRSLDFGDLIMKTVQLYDRHPHSLEHWQDRFRHILIDEYQDTNHAQYRLIRLLADRYRQITVVGDPDQSIYAWRGADIRNILNFEKDYPECGIIKMEQNYRSTQVILDAANELIKRNEIRKPKDLWTEKKGGEKIRIFQARDEREEADHVIESILRSRSEGIPLADQVIFYRTHAQSRVIEDVLRRFNVPYRIVGGVRFYDRKEIKDIIAYLKVLALPHDDLSLQRIINVPARGIGKKAVELIAAAAKARDLSLDDYLHEKGSLDALPPRSRKAVSTFVQVIDSLRVAAGKLPLGELLEKVLERSGYLQALELEKTAEAAERIENIEEFFSVVREYEEEKGKDTTLSGFLEDISLMTNLDAWDQGTNVLTLMTLHMAKGLEFPHVFIVGLEEGIFPSGNPYLEDREDLEEERRLCYVGVTRAKERLHMSFASQRRIYGSVQHNLPSRFINELPAELILMEGSSYGGLSRPDYGLDEVVSDDDIELEFDDGLDGDDVRNRILFD